MPQTRWFWSWPEAEAFRDFVVSDGCEVLTLEVEPPRWPDRPTWFVVFLSRAEMIQQDPPLRYEDDGDVVFK